MSVALKKIEGVASVDVSLNEGSAEIRFRRGSAVTPEQIREAIRRNGFTPKEAEVKAAGRIVERGGRPAFEVSGIELVYVLVGADPAMEAVRKLPAGSRVVLRGRLPAAVAASEPERLEVLAVEPESAAGASRSTTPAPAPRPRDRAR